MTDKLQVDLVAGNADKAVQDVKAFKSELISADATVAKLSANATSLLGKDFSSAISTVEKQALNLDFTLRNVSRISFKTDGMDGIGKAADRARAELQKTLARLREIETEAGRTKDPAILKKLQAEAAKTSSDLDRLDDKIRRVGEGRVARNAGGSNINGRGLLNSAAGAGIPFASEASSAIDAAAAAGIGTAALATAGALAAAGVVIVKWSERARAEAEKRLKAEVSIVAAINKQIIAQKNALKEFQDADAARARANSFQSNLSNSDTSDRGNLQKQLDLQKRLRDADPNGKNAQEFDGNIRAIEARIKALNIKATADADAAFNQRNEDFKAAQKQAAEYEKKQLEAINAGRQRVAEFGKSTDELFAKLEAQRGETNPFVKVFTEAEQAIESTRLATAALSKDLQKQAADMVTAANANALFSARVDSAINAVNLRSDAAAFRGTDSTKTADDIAAKALARFKQDLAQGVIRNPANLALFRSGTSAKTGLELFDFQRQQEQAGGFFRNPIFEAQARADIASRPENQTVQQRLDKQLAALASIRPENDAQKADADRRIIALTQGLNPGDLTDAQRNAAASSRENEAVRSENAEKDAKKQREDDAKTQQSIDKNIAALLKLAAKDGLSGIIRIINEAEDKASVSLGKRPSPRDVTALTDK